MRTSSGKKERKACPVTGDVSTCCWGDGTAGQLGRNDIGERNEIFMVDGFNVDLGAQPDLRGVTGGFEGQAGVGDLMYVPCGLVHTLENVVSWGRAG